MDLFDIFQQYKIHKNHKDALSKVNDANSRITDSQFDIHTLNEKVEHLSMVVMAMGELLENLGVSKELLVEKIEEIDLRDGKLDGKLAATNNCQSCGRKVSARHARCLYCGTPIDKNALMK